VEEMVLIILHGIQMVLLQKLIIMELEKEGILQEVEVEEDLKLMVKMDLVVVLIFQVVENHF
jgi:hypothetical protein